MGEPATMTILGIAPKVVAAACVGGAVSMVLGGGKWWERLTRGLAGPIAGILLYPIGSKIIGWALSRGIGPEWMPTPTDLDVAAGIGIALLGIIGCQALLNAGAAAVDDADDLIHAALKARRRK